MKENNWENKLHELPKLSNELEAKYNIKIIRLANKEEMVNLQKLLSEAYDMYHDRLDKSNANLEDQPDEIMDGDGYRYCGVTYKGVHAEGYLDKNTGVFYLNEELDKLRNNLDTNGVK